MDEPAPARRVLLKSAEKSKDRLTPLAGQCPEGCDDKSKALCRSARRFLYHSELDFEWVEAFLFHESEKIKDASEKAHIKKLFYWNDDVRKCLSERISNAYRRAARGKTNCVIGSRGECPWADIKKDLLLDTVFDLFKDEIGLLHSSIPVALYQNRACTPYANPDELKSGVPPCGGVANDDARDLLHYLTLKFCEAHPHRKYDGPPDQRCDILVYEAAFAIGHRTEQRQGMASNWDLAFFKGIMLLTLEPESDGAMRRVTFMHRDTPPRDGIGLADHVRNDLIVSHGYMFKSGKTYTVMTFDAENPGRVPPRFMSLTGDADIGTPSGEMAFFHGYQNCFGMVKSAGAPHLEWSRIELKHNAEETEILRNALAMEDDAISQAEAENMDPPLYTNDARLKGPASINALIEFCNKRFSAMRPETNTPFIYAKLKRNLKSNSDIVMVPETEDWRNKQGNDRTIFTDAEIDMLGRLLKDDTHRLYEVLSGLHLAR